MPKRIFLKKDGLKESTNIPGYITVGFDGGKFKQIDESGKTDTLSYYSYEAIASSYRTFTATSSILLRIGEKYTIDTYSAGEDFSKVGGPTAAETDGYWDGFIFTATSRWSNAFTYSTLSSLGNPIIENVLENTFNFTPDWNTDSSGSYYFDFPKPEIENKIFYNKLEYTTRPQDAATRLQAADQLQAVAIDKAYIGVNFLSYQHIGATISLPAYPNSYINTILFHSSGDIFVGGGQSDRVVEVPKEGSLAAKSKVYNLNYISKLDNLGDVSKTWKQQALDGDVSCIIELLDGSILVGGQFSNSLVKLDVEGNEDETFRSNLGTGFLKSNYSKAQIKSIKQQSDGKILVAGDFVAFNKEIPGEIVDRLSSDKAGIIRLNSDGTEDTSFNLSGVGIGGSEESSIIESICIDSDDKILIGGYFNTYNEERSMMFCRLNSDGTYDTTFMTNLLDNHYEMLDSGVSVIIEHLDGYILGGDFSRWGIGPNLNDVLTQNSFSMRYCIVKIKKDGLEDSDFYFNMNINSTSLDETGIDGKVKCIATQSNGGILIGGDFSTIFKASQSVLNVIRLKSDGQFDNNFTQLVGFDNVVYAIATSYQSNEVWFGGQFTNFRLPSEQQAGIELGVGQILVETPAANYISKLYSPTRLKIELGTDIFLEKSRLSVKLYK